MLTSLPLLRTRSGALATVCVATPARAASRTAASLDHPFIKPEEDSYYDRSVQREIKSELNPVTAVRGGF